ncbi:hypothetical protein [Cellulomonas sp. Root137]|uniref:hypothetical protein n=1 Tax=Cellulomonas sp. Root137 TaxID=1736459 RepID=UPI0006FAFC78|nr:hypothetical protein [Cellulomonas sp. Root137]KQY44554.1 hypothetical protein ASD18_13715 [Cellulomonas sp. Root137]
MSITTSTLTRAAGLAAVAAGLLFITVQINHPQLDADFVTTTEWHVRQSMKVLMAVLALAGITGMYLRQVRQIGVLGLVGYLVAAGGYLVIMCSEVIGLVVLPAIAHSTPGYVNDILAIATGGSPTGDVGSFMTLNLLGAFGYVVGGLLFGIALYRANVLARWASVLLAVSTVATLAIPLLPQVNQRLFAIPDGIALVALGYSLWRDQRTSTGPATLAPVGAQLDAAGAR